jgi:hypothetical protein
MPKLPFDPATGFEPHTVQQRMEFRQFFFRFNPLVAIFEQEGRVVAIMKAKTMPFSSLAEGLISKYSRGDRTPLELFLTGVTARATEMRRVFVREPNREPPAGPHLSRLTSSSNLARASSQWLGVVQQISLQ